MSTPTYRLPNSSVAIQTPDGYVAHSWYTYLAQIGKVVQGTMGVGSLTVGPGLTAQDNTGASVSTLSTSGTINLNLDYYGSGQGDLLVRGPLAWQGLAAGPAGSTLTSNGLEEEPSWQTVEGPQSSLLGNIQTSTSPLVPVLLTLLLDSYFGNTWGSIIFRGQNNWQALPPGAVPNLRLATGGPNADPFWARVVLPVSRALGAPNSPNVRGAFAPLGYQDTSGNYITLSDGLGG